MRCLASWEGIVSLGVTQCVCVCLSAEPRLQAALVSAAKVMRCIQCSVVISKRLKSECSTVSWGTSSRHIRILVEVVVCFLAGCVLWTAEQNTNVFGGVRVEVESLEDCQAECINNASCNGVDWNPGNAVGQKCWMSGPWSGDRNPGGASGVTHYNLTRLENCGKRRVGHGSLFFDPHPTRPARAWPGPDPTRVYSDAMLCATCS